MEKVDFKKTLKNLYGPSAKSVSEVDVPPMNFLMVDGEGDPDREQFREAVEALYALSYAVKFAVKKSGVADYGVLPLEGLWWFAEGSDFDLADRESWRWTAMIMQPDFVTSQLLEEARTTAAKKKDLPALEKVRFDVFKEGRSAQILHTGPFSEEAPNLQKLHRYVEEQGGERNGKHHEIYLKDPNRTAPQKLRTVLRQPFE